MEKNTLNDLRQKAYLSGGEMRIKRQHEKGKLTARERLNILLDPDSFEEWGLFVTSRTQVDGTFSDGVITGTGTIFGRTIFVYAQDFTMMGGSLGEAHAEKIVTLMEKAIICGAPIICLCDSGGARIQEGVAALAGYADIFQKNIMASGVIPQISVIMGPCAGGAAYSPAITDFTFMVDKTAYMFLTGPDVIKTVTRETVTQEALGGAMVHSTKSGLVDVVGENDTDTLEKLRIFMTFLPDNNKKKPEKIPQEDPWDRPTNSLENLIPKDPKTPYDMHELIQTIIDSKDFSEIKRGFAPNLITGFSRLDGEAVGIIANQPFALAGCLDINASIKGARFVRFCDAFNIPIITFVDVPGFLPGVHQEHQGIIRHGAKLLYAYGEATVPKITLITKKAYGGAYDAMGSKHLRGDLNYAWPSGEIAVMGPEGAVEVLHKGLLSPEDFEDAVTAYKKNQATPLVAASRGYIDDIIDPKDTRKRLIQGLRILKNKEVFNPWKKHGNIPL